MILMILLDDQSFMFSMKVLYDDEQKVCATCKKVRVHTSVCKLVLNFCNFHEVDTSENGGFLHAPGSGPGGRFWGHFGCFEGLGQIGCFEEFHGLSYD